MMVFRKIFETLTRRGRVIWIASVFLGILASIFEVASAASFSLLTSSLFGGRKSNLGVLANVVPFAITPGILISILGIVFFSKLIFQLLELNLKTKSAEEFFNSMFRRKVELSHLEIQISDAPISNLANRMHVLTHNIYYPAGMIVSEVLILIFLIPFVFLTSPKASSFIFGITLFLSIPILGVVRKKITELNYRRMKIDSVIDYMTYSDFRTFFDQGLFLSHGKKLSEQIHIASEVDRKIVKLGTYSRLTIELCFIVSVLLTFSLIDKLVPADARIQFFAILAYSFFRVIPAFSRIIAARNQIASHQFEFMSLMQVAVAPNRGEGVGHYSTFNESLLFRLDGTIEKHDITEVKFSVGDFVAIKGETGIGKTTLLKMVGGFGTKDINLEVDGVKLLKPSDWKPRAAFVSQNPFLAGDTLLEMVTGDQQVSELDAERYKKALDVSCLNGSLMDQRSYISNERISGGERKQIALARAIYLNPEILLLDELTAGMDTDLAEKIFLNLLAYPKFKLVLAATHDSILEEEFTQVIQL